MRVLLGLFFSLCLISSVYSSSHSEAPGTASAPFQDLADWYTFLSYEKGREDRVILMTTAYGGIKPGFGPNYATLSDGHMFEMHVSCNNNGRSDTDHLWQFYFGARMGGAVGTQRNSFDETDQCSYDELFDFTGNQGVTLPVGPDKDGNTFDIPVPLKLVVPFSDSRYNTLHNWFETYNILYTGPNGQTTRLNGPNSDGSFNKPFDYAGQKSFGTPSQYENYAKSFIYTINNMPGCPGVRVFVGPRADPFGIDLGRTFDLLNYVPVPGFTNAVKDCPEHDSQANSNVVAMVLEVPKSCLTCPRVAGEANIIGTWARVGTLVHDDSAFGHSFGTQTNRLGMPLVNEVVIGLRDKKYFSTDVPNNDGQFLKYVQYPTFPEVVNLYFRDIVNSELGVNLATIAPRNLPRADLVATFLTGFEGVNQPRNVGASEMLRINLDIPPTPVENQDHYGALARDFAGFPNGRRVGDDVLDIVVQVAMGAVCTTEIDALKGKYCNASSAPVGSVLFRDGAPVYPSNFPASFPFLNTPNSGGILNHENPGSCDNGCSSSSSLSSLFALFTFVFAALAFFF